MAKGDTEKVLQTIELDQQVVETLKYYAGQEDMDMDRYVQRMMTDGFTIATLIGESVVRLESVDPWIPEELLEPVGEDGSDTPNNTKVYRDLRESFPPVSAGIDYPKSFTSATGFSVKIDDIDNDNQVDMKKTIEDFNKNVFMDEMTRGLDLIMDILLDELFTVGVAAAEIVYEGWETDQMEFEDWATPTDATDHNPAKWNPKDLVDSDWKKLKSIKQLKIVHNGYHRLKPYRDPVTWKILYYTVDEFGADPKVPLKKLLPWQILWLSWNRRGSDLKGKSLIKSVADTAIMLQRIFRNIGISFDRWADQKYFFILGDARSGRSWAPQHVASFSRDVQKMVKDKGTGIPVPAGFDVKSIGGEGGVYDGGQIIDQLLTLVCTGMKYPKAFLNQENRGEDDKAWLAWLVTYSRDQKQLRRTIEDQLWKRQLYCTNGMFRRVPQRGVPIKDQEYEPTYVPEMEWSSEGKWHQETKLKMLKSILDAANPVNAELKYEIERDMARTLGYSEKELESMKEIIKIDRETDKLASEAELINKQMELEIVEKAYEEEIHLELEPLMKFGKVPFDVQLERQEKEMAISEPEESSEEGKTAFDDNPKRPKPKPIPRLEGGVHRSTKPTDEPNPKSQAKSQGESRKPKTRSIGETALVPEALPVQDVNINIKVDGPDTIKIETEPQQLDVKIETEPQRLSIDSFAVEQDPIKVNVSDESFAKMLVDQERLKADVIALLDSKTKDIADSVNKNETILGEMKKLQRQIGYRKNKDELSEKDKLAIEERKTKIELMRKMMEEE